MEIIPKEITDRIKILCLQQEQLDKGMPILEALDPEVEALIKGEG